MPACPACMDAGGNWLGNEGWGRALAISSGSWLLSLCLFQLLNFLAASSSVYGPTYTVASEAFSYFLARFHSMEPGSFYM